MSENKKSQPLLPSRGTFNLFLTRTDLHSWPRHLPVSRRYHPTGLYERTHSHVMTYRVRADNPDAHGATDFDLTYGARTTAGFPLAVPPVTYKEIRQKFPEARPGDGAVGRRIRRYAYAGTPPERFRYQESPHGKWRGARQPSVCPCYPDD